MQKLLLMLVVFCLFVYSCKDKEETIPFKTVERGTAIKMIAHYLDTNRVSHHIDSIIKIIRIERPVFNSLNGKNVVSVKFITAADLTTNYVTVLIQQKIKKGNDSSYVYYNMRSPLADKVVEQAGVCPLPVDCTSSIEE